MKKDIGEVKEYTPIVFLHHKRAQKDYFKRYREIYQKIQALQAELKELMDSYGKK